MKSRIFTVLVALVAAAVLIIGTAQPPVDAQSRSGLQQMAQTRFAKDGAQALGAGVLQASPIGTLSASIATTTRTEVVAAPASGSVFLLGIWIEKMTVTTGTVTVTYGTGANCATGTTTLLTIGPQTATSLIPVGLYPVYAQVPATKALCLQTDAATTSAKALAN